MKTYKKYENPTKYTMKDKKKTTYCPSCHHTVEFWSNCEKKLCNWCHNYVYRNKKIEFKEKLMKELRK